MQQQMKEDALRGIIQAMESGEHNQMFDENAEGAD